MEILAKRIDMSTVKWISVVLLLGGGTSVMLAGPVFSSGSYTAGFTFTDALGPGGTTMAVAYDGVSYWSASGGSPDGTRYAQYSGAGAVVGTYAPGLDFRSVFTDASGNVYAREYASSIYLQTSPGVFISDLDLSGGSLDAQSAVVRNPALGEYDAMSSGTVSRWDLSGNYLGAVTLAGFGGAENTYPQSRGLAVASNNWLTYDGAGTLSAWSFGGARLDTTTLIGAGTSFDSDFSLSYANGMVFIVDEAGGTWSGFDVGLNGSAVPEPSAFVLIGFGLLGIAGWRRVRG